MKLTLYSLGHCRRLNQNIRRPVHSPVLISGPLHFIYKRNIAHRINTTFNAQNSSDLPKEIVYLICGNFLVFMAIHSTEGTVWFEVTYGTQGLPLALDLQLTFSYCLQEIA